MITNRNVINFLGVNVDPVDTGGLLDRVITFAQSNIQHKVMYINADCMLIAQKDEDYRKVLNKAQLVYADGYGIVLGARLLGHRIPDRSTAADFMPVFCKTFADNGLKLFLLGSRPGVAELAGEKLKRNHPHLQIVGVHHGYFSAHKTESILRRINAAAPHIVLIGMGAPYQEKWAAENAPNLDVPVLWTVGGLFDFLSGRLKRGPQVLLDHGFEWLCRLCVEPRRLSKRYILGNIAFMWHIIKWKYIRPEGRKMVHGNH